jgi:hypothetical protein
MMEPSNVAVKTIRQSDSTMSQNRHPCGDHSLGDSDSGSAAGKLTFSQEAVTQTAGSSRERIVFDLCGKMLRNWVRDEEMVVKNA